MALTLKKSASAGALWPFQCNVHQKPRLRAVGCRAGVQARQLSSLSRPVLSVTQLQSELVTAVCTPSISTPDVQELSLLDQTVGGFPLYGSPLFFRASLSLDHLRSSLQQTLGLYPPLCGRLRLDKDALHVTCNNAGALLSMGTSPNTLAELVPHDSSQPFLACGCWAAMPGLPDTGTAFANKDEPLLRVSIIRLADGATVIAVAGCHVVADFRTLASFLEHWAAAYRSLDAATNASAGVGMVSINALAASSMAHGRQATGIPETATATSSTATAALPAAAASCAVDHGSLAAGTSGHISRSAPVLPGGSPVSATQQVDALAADKALQEDDVNADWTLWRLLGIVRGILWSNWTGGGCIMVSRVVSEARIRQLKKQAMADLHLQMREDSTLFVSGHDCLLARVWQVVGELPGRVQEPFPLHFVVNMRDRVEPPLSPHACGNVISAAFGQCSEVPSRMALGSLALEIRRAIGRCADSFPANLAWLEARRAKLVGGILPRMLLPPHPLHDTARGTAWVSQWALDHTKLQFGAGPESAPVWAVTAVPSTMLSAPQFLVTQRVPAAAGGGWQVSAMLTVRQAEAWVAREL